MEGVNEKFDTTDMQLSARTITGMLDGSTPTQILYLGMMLFGAITLFSAFPATYFNERKSKNLAIEKEIIDERLYRADEKGNKTSEKNENKLVFARGPITFS